MASLLVDTSVLTQQQMQLHPEQKIETIVYFAFLPNLFGLKAKYYPHPNLCHTYPNPCQIGQIWVACADHSFKTIWDS